VDKALYISSSPHIHSGLTTARIMRLVIYALLPAVAVAVVFFGLPALKVMLICTLGCVACEALCCKLMKQPLSIRDSSAALTGILLALNLPASSPWWMALLGSAIAIVIGKMIFGGLGYNPFNPALVARVVLLISFPIQMTSWTAPAPLSMGIDAVSSATPLGEMKSAVMLTGQLPEMATSGFDRYFYGLMAGSLGEVSALVLLLGGLFLLWKKIITWHIPVSFIGSVVVMAGAFWLIDPTRYPSPLFHLVTGGLMLGVFFMATDMVTSPTGKTASRVFGFGCGFLTVFIRRFTYYPEGVTFAFLIMNGLAYLFDRIGADPIFGQVHERNKRLWAVASHLAAVLVLVAAAGVSFGGGAVAGKHRTDATQTRAVRRHFPRADRMVEMTSYDAQVRRYRIYRGRDLLGFFAEVRGDGYGGEMGVQVALGPDRDVRAVHIGAHRESPTLGTLVTAPAFLGRFAGFHQGNRTLIRDRVEAISGATVSSRAVMRAVERALAAGDPATARSATATGAPLPRVDDGVYAGTGQGYQGPIAVHVTVQGGRVTDIAIRGHNETAGVGTRAMDALLERVIQSQSVGIDAVSGATGTSQGFLTAVEHALDERENGE